MQLSHTPRSLFCFSTEHLTPNQYGLLKKSYLYMCINHCHEWMPVSIGLQASVFPQCQNSSLSRLLGPAPTSHCHTPKCLQFPLIGDRGTSMGSELQYIQSDTLSFYIAHEILTSFEFWHFGFVLEMSWRIKVNDLLICNESGFLSL
jgi:hypothetical protein